MYVSITCTICDTEFDMKVEGSMYAKFKNGGCADTCFPNLTDVEKKCIVLGICPSCQSSRNE